MSKIVLERRRFLIQSAAAGLAGATATAQAAVKTENAIDAETQGNPAVFDKLMGTMTSTLNVNGRRLELTADPRTTLLDALREHFKLTGTKKGCDHGQCGSCTVLVSGRRINACLTLAVMHDGEDITTIEGLGTVTDLHPLQRAFIEQDGFQCGYCTPGQIISAVGVLDEVAKGIPSRVTEGTEKLPILSDAEIRERMSGNICRCAAYPNIVAAIRAVGTAPR